MAELPKEILITRIKNEVKRCRTQLAHEIVLTEENFTDIPVELHITMKNVPGPAMNGDRVGSRFFHKLVITITDKYPYKKPEVRWKSPIYHPNICAPDEGGFVCSKLLDAWNFASDLSSFIKGIEVLLANPNPQSPFNTPTCMSAANYFNLNPYKPVVALSREKPKIVIIK